MAKRQRKLFFSSEYSVKLFVDKEDGTRIVIVDEEELYFKLKFDKMKLGNPEEFFRRYPDGWVKGRVTFLSQAGGRSTPDFRESPDLSTGVEPVCIHTAV